jgi:hypothetical protein
MFIKAEFKLRASQGEMHPGTWVPSTIGRIHLIFFP